MEDNNNVKLSDFGFAVQLKGEQQTQILGSPLYMAPEIVRGEEYGTPVDIWAVGIITHVLFTG